MKPYGREKKIHGTGEWKKDYHPRPKRLFCNWWEADFDNIIPRSSIKQKLKQQLNIDYGMEFN